MISYRAELFGRKLALREGGAKKDLDDLEGMQSCSVQQKKYIPGPDPNRLPLIHIE